MRNDSEYLDQGFKVSTDQALLDLKLIYDFLSRDSYWAAGIPQEVLHKAIKNCLCFGVYQHGKQVGFARVTTDRATFAYLGDVFILPDFRGLGLSKWLMKNIMAHEDLQGLRRWILATKDAHTLYQQFGFKPLPKPENFMEILKPYQ